MPKKSQEQKDAAVQQKEAFGMYKQDRESSRAKSLELAGNQKDRFANTIKERDYASNMLSGIRGGKDVTSLLSGQIGLMDKAGKQSEMETQMQMNTGSRALMGAPDSNLMAQLDKQSGTERASSRARDILGLVQDTEGASQKMVMDADTILNNDEYNIANVLSGNVAQAGQFSSNADRRRTEADSRPNFFSKYIMPLATAGIGAAGSYFSGGLAGGKPK